MNRKYPIRTTSLMLLENIYLNSNYNLQATINAKTLVNKEIDMQMIQKSATYLKEKDYQQAETAFEEAIKLDSKCIEAYQGLVEVYRGTEDNEHLEKVYKDAVAMINDECMANGKISED